MEELVDIFDELYTHIGIATKSQARKNGNWVRSIHVWIINPDDEGFILFQKRGKGKLIYPNCLDISAAGHYTAGERIEDGVREVSEELGLHINYKELIPLGIKFDISKLNNYTIREFCHTYLLESSKQLRDYKFTDGEVEGLVKISIKDGLALFNKETDIISAEGVEWDPIRKKMLPTAILLDRDQFIPRIDQYYYKIFIIAKNYLLGDRYLSI